MATDWVQFALKLAENARAGVIKDKKRLEALRSEQAKALESQVVASSR
jgi:hypothetical protein